MTAGVRSAKTAPNSCHGRPLLLGHRSVHATPRQGCLRRDAADRSGAGLDANLQRAPRAVRRWRALCAQGDLLREGAARGR
eukprot:scaffold95853_cov57-Phaeocystis_antarctica.AAC.1